MAGKRVQEDRQVPGEVQGMYKELLVFGPQHSEEPCLQVMVGEVHNETGGFPKATVK